MTERTRTGRGAEPADPPPGGYDPVPSGSGGSGPADRVTDRIPSDGVGSSITVEEERGRDGGRWPGLLRRQLQQALALVTLAVLVLFFSLANPNFASGSNLSAVLLQTAVVGILALGVTFVIITGGIDLSVGTGMTLCSVFTGLCLVNWGLPLVVGILGGLAMGALMGFVNGLNVTVLGLPPFIATLAMMLVAQGLALILSGVRPIYFSDIPSFRLISGGFVVPGIPNAVLILFGLAGIAWVVLSKTVLGRFTYAIGSNEEAARLSGINTRGWLIVVYTMAGLFTGAAGVVIAARLNSAQPQLGVGYELQAIAAVIIGGTSLLGGRGSVIGTLIGALIMSVLVNGLRIMEVQSEWQNVVVGIVILVAVFTDNLRRSGSGGRLAALLRTSSSGTHLINGEESNHGQQARHRARRRSRRRPRA